MENIISQTGLPDCKIIRTLISKISEKKDCDINFIFHLDEIRKIISDEITRINLLFPEYTPHDERYHLKKLFHIADGLLGGDLIENMNLTELFVFSVSLYAHDWGMAISEDEKEYILMDSDETSSFILLEDEKSRFKKYCINNNIVTKNLNDIEWQEYIRQTHAFRSGIRVKSYFEKINSGIAEITSRICEGHYIDFSVIDDYNSYPTDYSVLRETINVKALTLYLRLVDLLDLGEDRTPYVLWKFVSPKNKFSQMEWSKHRALQPVSFPNYQTGRYIQVDGSTSDHNVYMSIMDLKRYVNDQFKQSSDILNRMNHTYHKLNISHIDWRIAARGFKPIPIQFEFDRMRMFEILGDEIYQNDGYVFLRELIQNSIDAIKIRKEIIENKGLEFNNGKVIIKVHDYNDFYYKISIIDNGVGMDEYIIRNYLSVAGRSYYNSKDFEKEGFKMEPISRFGIGVLSCFMLSDYIEITTYRDPYITTTSEKLKITIPAKENYFRIETLQDAIAVGTTFNVYLLKEKLVEYKIDQLNIKEYVKEIAGFVEFPIEVIENNEVTIIHNPTFEVGNDINRHLSISYSFPFEKAILPQNINVAKEYFTEKKISLKSDLKLDKIEGCITYLLPNDEKLDIINIGHSWPINDVKLIHLDKELKQENRLQWHDEWTNYGRMRSNLNNNKVLSIRKHDTYSVYLNGILLPDASIPEISRREEDDFYINYNYLMDCFLVPQMIINVPKSKEIKIDLARTTISDNKNWDEPIWEALFIYIKNTELKQILKKDAKMRYFSIGKLKTFYRFTDKIILEKLITNIKHIPIPIFSSKNKLDFTYLDNNFKKKDLRVPSSIVRIEMKVFLASTFLTYKKPYDGFLNYKIGNDIIALGEEYHDDDIIASIENMDNLINSLLRKYYTISKIEFITSPLGADFPWVNEIYSLKSNASPMEGHMSDLSETDINIIDFNEFENLLYKHNRTFKRIPKLVIFDTPYQDKLFYSWEYMNKSHPVTIYLIKLFIRVYQAKENLTLPEDILGNIIDDINQLPFMNYTSNENKYPLDELNKKINDIIEKCVNQSLVENKIITISMEDFIPNSIINEDGISSMDLDPNKLNESKIKWGQKIE